MEKEVIFTKGAAVPIFKIAHAVRWGDLVFTSGHVPRNPEDGVFVGGDIQNQTRRVFKTLASVLEASDSSLDNVIKATVYLRHIEDRLGFNEVWHEYYSDAANCPARTTIKAGASGHVPRNPEDGVFVGGDIQNQTRRVFKTLASVLEASDSSLDNVIKATVYLRHIEDRLGFNEVWHEYYSDAANCPARTTIKAGDLAPGVGDIEIEVIAHVNQA